MGQSSNRILACSLLVLAAMALTACPQKSPETRVLEARSKYTVEPTGVLIQELEAEEAADDGQNPAAVMSGEVSVSASAAETAAEGEMSEAEILDEETGSAPGPRSVDVLIDLLVRFNATGDALPGVTIEIVHKDPFDTEKGRHLVWVDTPGLSKREVRQVPVKLQVESYEDGDEISVEFTPFVPPEKRGDYREFAAAAP